MRPVISMTPILFSAPYFAIHFEVIDEIPTRARSTSMKNNNLLIKGDFFPPELIIFINTLKFTN